MKTILSLSAGAALVAAAGYMFLTNSPDPAEAQSMTIAPKTDAIVAVTLPSALSPDAVIGKRVFDQVCAACHGENAAGKQGFGPPLVHKIYEPSHHGDMSFVMAVQNGVRAHHWPFGNMPPQDGVTQAETAAVIAYVRELQRANGIN